MANEHDANGMPLKYDRHGKPINAPAMEFEIESIEVHWAGIGRLLLGFVAMPLLLGTLSGGLAGASEIEHNLFSDYQWLASNWMLIHALICCVSLPLFLLQREPSSADWCSCILALLYCAHQFEENGRDLSGRRFAFASHLAQLTRCSANADFSTKGAREVVTVTGDCGFDEYDLLWNNCYAFTGMLLLMPVYALPYSSRDAALMQNAVWVLADAIIIHIIPAGFVYQTYNPGFLVALVCCAPFSIYVIVLLIRQARLSSPQAILAFIIGCAGPVSMLLAPLFLKRAGYAHLCQACMPLLTCTSLVFKGKPRPSAGKGKKHGSKKSE